MKGHGFLGMCHDGRCLECNAMGVLVQMFGLVYNFLAHQYICDVLVLQQNRLKSDSPVVLQLKVGF